jgi:hypothetical protein
MFLGIYCPMSASAAGRITEPRAKGIVARVRWDDLDDALLQSRQVSARLYWCMTRTFIGLNHAPLNA